MLLADGFVLVWFGGMFLVLLFASVWVTFAVLRWVFGAFRAVIFGACSPERSESPARSAHGLVCPHPRCGHLNRRQARFCARCGRRTRHVAGDVDAYG